MQGLDAAAERGQGRWVNGGDVGFGAEQRILATAIVERFANGPDGRLVPITEGCTRRVAMTNTHAGIVRVARYSLVLR